MDIDTLIFYISSPEVQETILPLKIGFLALSLFFLFTLVILFFKTSWLKYILLERMVEFLTYHPYGIKKITKEWLKIFKRLEKGAEPEYKFALVEADEMFDETLKKMGYTGKTFEERVDRIAPLISEPEEVREAHKIRNNIVYDPNYRLELDQAKRTLEIYEQALRELEVF